MKSKGKTLREITQIIFDNDGTDDFKIEVILRKLRAAGYVKLDDTNSDKLFYRPAKKAKMKCWEKSSYIKRLKTELDAMEFVTAALANELNMQNEKRACDKERVTLFELLEEIQRLKEWRFENCKHRTGWCRDKHSCESCHFAKTKEIKNG